MAAIASLYAAYSSGSAARDAAMVAANSNVQVALMEKQNKDRLSDIEMVKLALNILGGDISDKTLQSRTFALSLLQKYSGVVLTEPQVKEWRLTGSVGWLDPKAGTSSTLQNLLDRSKADAMRNYMPAPDSNP